MSRDNSQAHNSFSRHDANYFIDFFSRISDEQWHAGALQSEDGRLSALGHLGGPESFRGEILLSLFFQCGILHPGPGIRLSGVASVNDGYHPDFKQKTPKKRILAALHFIKRRSTDKYEV